MIVFLGNSQADNVCIHSEDFIELDPTSSSTVPGGYKEDSKLYKVRNTGSKKDIVSHDFTFIKALFPICSHQQQDSVEIDGDEVWWFSSAHVLNEDNLSTLNISSHENLSSPAASDTRTPSASLIKSLDLETLLLQPQGMVAAVNYLGNL